MSSHRAFRLAPVSGWGIAICLREVPTDALIPLRAGCGPSLTTPTCPLRLEAEIEIEILERVPNRQNRWGILKRGRIMIHHDGWEGGQHGWRSPIRGICGSAWFERSRRVGAGMKSD